MTKPPFEPGNRWKLAAIEVEVVQGNHGNGDQVLRIRTPGGQWAKMPMDLGALQMDFYDQNEPKRYRYIGEWDGRTMYPRLLNTAIVDGWQRSVAEHLDPFRKRRD